MARDKNQRLMFNDAELSLLNNTFSENDELLYTIRKVILQFPLEESEKAAIRGMSRELYDVIKKRVFPDVDPEAPFMQLSDLYQSLNTDLKNKSEEDMLPLLEAKQLECEYLEQQFAVLKDIDGTEQKIRLDAWKNLKRPRVELHQAYIETVARNFLLSYVDTFLSHIKVMAGVKKETPEEQKKRLERDSSK